MAKKPVNTSASWRVVTMARLLNNGMSLRQIVADGKYTSLRDLRRSVVGMPKVSTGLREAAKRLRAQAADLLAKAERCDAGAETVMKAFGKAQIDPVMLMVEVKRKSGDRRYLPKTRRVRQP